MLDKSTPLPIITTTVIVSVLLTGLVQPATAQSLNQLKVCTWIEDDAKRLACFDLATDELLNNTGASNSSNQTGTTGTLQGSDRTVTRTNTSKREPASTFSSTTFSGPQRTPASDFGFPTRSSTGGITVNVVEVKKTAVGRWVMVTEDGQAWRQTDAQKLNIIETPFTAQIEKSRLGSYWMQFSRNSGDTKLKVTRIQ